MASQGMLAERLVDACQRGDFPAAAAAIVEGAGVNDEADSRSVEMIGTVYSPLCAAVCARHAALVLHLLHLGADPDGTNVMQCASDANDAPEILQLLVDAGGDVSRWSGGERPIFTALGSATPEQAGALAVLLAQPTLQIDLKSRYNQSLEEVLERLRYPAAVAAMVRQEVRQVDEGLATP